MTKPRSTEQRLVEHVDRIADEHPPIDLGTVDFSVPGVRITLWIGAAIILVAGALALKAQKAAEEPT